MKKMRGVLVVLIAIFLSNVNSSLLAQTNRFVPASQVPILPVFANNPYALCVITNLLARPQPELSVPVVSLVGGTMGTFWMLKGPAAPLPFDPYPALPVYQISTNGAFIIDDRSVDYVALQRQQDALAVEEGLTNIMTFAANALSIDTNRLWLEVPTNALPGSNVFNVTIHNTITGNLYDVLTKTDLLLPVWTVESTVTGAVGDLTPVTMSQNERTNLFVWARESLIPIYTQPLAQEVYSGDTVTFSVAAGGADLVYQWTFNGTNIFGATSSSYTINNVNANNAGYYACIIQNADGTVYTQAATLTVFQGSGWPEFTAAYGQRQDYTFRSGVTYLIATPIELFGKTTIEAGAVIKFDYTGIYPCLHILGTLECKGEPYHPAVLTSMDDNTIGYPIGYHALYPNATGVPYLDLTEAGNTVLRQLRFRYTGLAVSTPSQGRLDVWDSQFLQCYAGVSSYFGGVDSFHNVLFSGCHDAVAGDTNAYAIEMEQVTADIANLWSASIAPSRLGLTNSVIIGDVGTAPNLYAVNTTINPAASDFQTNSMGNYYLADGSGLRQSGTTNISPDLLNELRQKTTQPPLALPALMEVAGQLTLLPQAPRYAGGLPDRGYYYDALDYTVAYLLNRGNIVVEPGTVVGFRNEYASALNRFTWWGFVLAENSTFTSHGTPARPVTFADIQTVQEQWSLGCNVYFVPDFEAEPSEMAPVMDFRFSDFFGIPENFLVCGGNWEFYSGSGDNPASPDPLVNWTMRDCRLHGGRISLGVPDDGTYYPGLGQEQYYGSGAVTWENNLFESVNISLNPTYYWLNGMVNCDLAFAARNNLFKGGSWFALEPIPASAGAWTLTDNFFDKANLQVDTNAPLNFDHNGYWPVPAGEALLNTFGYVLLVTAGDVSQLQATNNNLGGLQEVILGYAPPYASGPFGNYYLSTLTPLYEAGSRTAGEAGLSQYTTFTNQSKDASNALVNIGLHYIAATNSLPMDTDGDGVPDYVEVEHGTDPTLASTDFVTNDTYNIAYDDVDLSGNGLTGSAKRLLWVNPLSMDNPLNLSAIPQECTLSGIVEIPLNISTDVDTNTLFLLNINGIVGDTAVIKSNGNWFAQWDTTAVANGSYQTQLEYPFDDDTSAFGVTSFINVENDVCFPNNLNICGSSLFVVPQTIHTNGTFTMDVYDDQTNLVTSVIGTVDENGLCSDSNTSLPGITVSLQDTNGVDLPSTYFTVDVTTWPVAVANYGKFHPNAGSSVGHGRRRFGHEGPWNGVRGWVMAYMPIFGTDQTPSTEKLGELMRTAATAVLNKYGTEGILNGEYTESGGYASAMALSTASDWRTLATLLRDTSSRNFYYFGHAGKALIGSKKNPIYFDQDMLQNVILQNPANPLSTNHFPQHPYRFVFLDGCQTAAGTLPVLFGIPKMVVTNEVWNAAGLAPRSFLGWQSYTGTSYKKDGTPVPDDTRMRYMENFWNDWSGNQPLQNAIHNASADDLSNGQRFCQFDNVITLYGSPTLPFYQ